MSGAGTCDCMRDDVILWSTSLACPVFLAVNDDGCAALFDRDRQTGTASLKLVDGAGNEPGP